MTPAILNFLYYFGTALAAAAAFVLVYIWITPYPDLKLIREGAVAPAWNLGGATIGFSLPIASAIVHSVSIVDMWIWAGLSGLTQILAFFLIRLGLMRGLNLKGDHMSSAVLSSCLSIAVGILNAASLS